MKTVKPLLLFFFMFFVYSATFAQDCGYYDISSGSSFSYQILDEKGKITGTTRTTCIDVNKAGPGTTYKIKSESFDAKNRPGTVSEYAMRCEGGQFYVNLQNMLDPKSFESFKDMELQITGADMMYPASMSSGDALPDANITISAATGGVSFLNMVVNISNRKVLGNETVTVPAGTFNCYKITYDVETKLMFKINTNVVEYINKGVGNVKTETYDKKGKMLSATVLSEVKK